MNEMLGNQYFLAGRYKEATNHFEKVLLINPSNYTIKKKLVICYIQGNQIGMALQVFASLISEKIEVVLNSDVLMDECPCRKMIQELEQMPTKLNETERNISLGILWTYCDIINSREYFKKLLLKDPDNIIYKNINDSLNQSFLNKHKVKYDGKKRYFT